MFTVLLGHFNYQSYRSQSSSLDSGQQFNLEDDGKKAPFKYVVSVYCLVNISKSNGIPGAKF